MSVLDQQLINTIRINMSLVDDLKIALVRKGLLISDDLKVFESTYRDLDAALDLAIKKIEGAVKD